MSQTQAASRELYLGRGIDPPRAQMMAIKQHSLLRLNHGFVQRRNSTEKLNIYEYHSEQEDMFNIYKSRGFPIQWYLNHKTLPYLH